MGRGQVLRDKTEHCIIALKGKPVINLTNQTTSWQGWPRRDNSQKPDEFYAMVEELTPAPRYAEIFSRGGRNSKWDCHGDEIGKYPPGAPQQLPMPMPIAEPPARPAEDLPSVSEAACRERLKDLAVQVHGKGHVVTMTIDDETDENIGTCECGEVFAFPRSDLHKRMDLAIERHWVAAVRAAEAEAGQLDIPGFLQRPAEAPAAEDPTAQQSEAAA
jgi:hypothetical protein